MMSKAQKISINFMKGNAVVSIILFFCLYLFTCIGADATLEEVVIASIIGVISMAPSTACYLLATVCAKLLRKRA